MKTTAGSFGRGASGAVIRWCLGRRCRGPAVFVLLLLICATQAQAFLRITEEEMAFEDASRDLLKNDAARFHLGRHGELIATRPRYGGDGRMGCANVLKKEDGSYDLAVFDYPKRYYYGHITHSGDIIYNFDALPPGIDRNAFAGPMRWPHLDENGCPRFDLFPEKAPSPLAPSYWPADAKVIASTTTFPILTDVEKHGDVRAVVYACADNAFYVFPGRKIGSPFPLLLVAAAERKCMNLISPDHPESPFLSIIDGGWADSCIVFKRNVDNSMIEPERSLPWPYLDDKGSPKLLDYPTRFRVGNYVTDVWKTYDKSGKHAIPMHAPVQ